MVLRFIDDHYKSAIKWGAVSLVAYVLPDIYIFEGTRTLPKKVIVILCLVIIGDVVACRRHASCARFARDAPQRPALLEAASVLDGHA